MSEQAQYGNEHSGPESACRDAGLGQHSSTTANEAMLAAIDEAVFLFSVERDGGSLRFRFQRHNPAHGEMTGITPDDRGETPRELFGERKGAVVASRCRECVQKQEQVEFEATVRESAQTTRRKTELTPVTEDGEVTGVVGVVRETAGDEKLSRTKEQRRMLFDEAPAGIAVHDEDGKIIEVNDTLVEMLGYSRKELQSMEIPDFEVGIDEGTLQEKWASMDVGGTKKIEIEGTHRRTDGTTYPVEVWVSKVSAKRTVLGRSDGTQFIGHVRDVSERKERERELEAQRDNLEILNQVVRHDIRNDLQLIQAYGELLDDHVDAAGSEYLRTVLESAANAVDLTTTARELAEVMLRPDAESRQVPFRQTLEEQLEEVQSTHPEAVVRVSGALPGTDVLCDEMLGSVFRNLLKNAIQHNDKDLPEVTVSADRRDGFVRVRVADNGPGIPDNQREEIFGRGEKGLDTGGTGLGLYLVRTLVDEYGGDVRVEDGRAGDPTTDGTDAEDDSTTDCADGVVFVVELPVAE